MSEFATLDRIVDLIKRLPSERRAEVVDALRELVVEPYVLSDDELAILQPALAEAMSGEGLSDVATDSALNMPWR